jgi:hypothetical protein
VPLLDPLFSLDPNDSHQFMTEKGAEHSSSRYGVERFCERLQW